MTNKEYADGLRQIADFYEEHPEFKQPSSGTLRIFPSGRDAFVQYALQLADGGLVTKEVTNGFFYARRSFGKVELVIADYQQNVCTQVGTKTISIEEEVPTSYETKTVVKEVPVWECPKTLAALASIDDDA